MLVYFMELKKFERYLLVNLLGAGARLVKNGLPGRGLTNVVKYCFTLNGIFCRIVHVNSIQRR